MNEEIRITIPDGDHEVQIDVSYDIVPEEPRTYDHPGYDTEIINLEVYHNYKDITDSLSENQIQKIKDYIWAKIQRNH